MADIFGRASQEFGGAMAADAVKLTFSGEEATLFDSGMLAQQLQMQYQQQVTRIYEIGTNKTYFIVGRTSGQVSMNRIIGPKAISSAFYRRYGDACNAEKNNLTFTGAAGCSTGGVINSQADSTYTVKHVLINSLGINVTAQDMVINEQVAMMFNSLEVGK
jgi:hypothetical protein